MIQFVRSYLKLSICQIWSNYVQKCSRWSLSSVVKSEIFKNQKQAFIFQSSFIFIFLQEKGQPGSIHLPDKFYIFILCIEILLLFSSLIETGKRMHHINQERSLIYFKKYLFIYLSFFLYLLSTLGVGLGSPLSACSVYLDITFSVHSVNNLCLFNCQWHAYICNWGPFVRLAYMPNMLSSWNKVIIIYLFIYFYNTLCTCIWILNKKTGSSSWRTNSRITPSSHQTPKNHVFGLCLQ